MNEFARKFQQKFVDPQVRAIRSSVLGYVTYVDRVNQKCNVVLIEKDGMRRRKNNLDFPAPNRGLEVQELKVGDTVEVAYRNNNYKHSYILRIHEDYAPDKDIESGQFLPDSTDLF